MDHEHHHSNGDHSAAHAGHSCCTPKHRRDWLLIVTSTIIVAAYASYVLLPHSMESAGPWVGFAMTIAEIINTIWWGILIGILMSGILSDIPRELIISAFGRPGSSSGIIRATLAGMLLDVCSHGILLVGMQLYKRGVGLGQLMAFLIASPWNSLSLTLILWALVGLPWTLVVIVLSIIIAIISGHIFQWLERRGTLSPNPNTVSIPEHFSFRREFGAYLKSRPRTAAFLTSLLKAGLMESRMILRWIFFGVVIAGAIQTFVPRDVFASVFAPTLLGLGATLLFATILEVCSEGSTPIAADFLLRANAPGNMFAFLMTGVATDYTEILSLKETTKSWKVAFFLPLVTVPQVALLGYLLNAVGT